MASSSSRERIWWLNAKQRWIYNDIVIQYRSNRSINHASFNWDFTSRPSSSAPTTISLSCADLQLTFIQWKIIKTFFPCCGVVKNVKSKRFAALCDEPDHARWEKFIIPESPQMIKRQTQQSVMQRFTSQKNTLAFTHHHAIHRQTLLGILFQVLHSFDVIVNDVVLLGLFGGGRRSLLFNGEKRSQPGKVSEVWRGKVEKEKSLRGREKRIRKIFVSFLFCRVYNWSKKVLCKQ